MGSGDTEPAELLPISVLSGPSFHFDRLVTGDDLPYCYVRVGGHVRSRYGILPGLLNVPVYAAAKAFGVDVLPHRSVLSLLTASLVCSLATLFLYLALTRVCLSRREALFFALTFAFGTCVWSVASRAMWQHGPSVLFLSAALWLLLSPGRGKTALAGLALALAVVNRPPNLLFALPLALYVILDRRAEAPGFFALAAVPAVLSAIYSAACLGNAFALTQAYSPGGFGSNVAAGLSGLLASPSRGLFVFSPILLFSVAGAAAAWRSEPDRVYRYLAVGAILFVLVYAAWEQWWGGVCFGYRLLIELTPALTLFLAAAWRHVIRPRRVWRAVFAALFVFSVGVQVLGAFVYPSDFNRGIDLETGRLWDWRASELVLCARRLSGAPDAPGPPEVAHVWWSPEKDDGSIPGWLDSSPGGKNVRGPLALSGWARSAKGDVEVRVVLDQRVYEPDRFPRPDVSRALPQLGDASRAGFRVILTRPGDEPEDHQVAVELRDPAGGVRRLGPIRFRWLR